MRAIKFVTGLIGFGGLWWLSLNAGQIIIPTYAAHVQLVAQITWWLIVVGYGIHILRSDR